MSVYSLIRYFPIACLLVAIGLPTAVSAQIYFDTAADSKLWLEGSSTVHRFDCIARSIQGTAYLDGNQDVFGDMNPIGADKEKEVANSAQNSINNQNSGSTNQNTETGNSPDQIGGQKMDIGTEQFNLQVFLKIPVKSFDCGRSRMNRDMYDALKSDTYEFITFEFDYAEPIERDQQGADSLYAEGYDAYNIKGVLNVAGVDRSVTLIVRGRQDGSGRYRVKGQKMISMNDYEIEPPTALRGLIRAHDELTVFFDLIVVQKTS